MKGLEAAIFAFFGGFGVSFLVNGWMRILAGRGDVAMLASLAVGMVGVIVGMKLKGRRGYLLQGLSYGLALGGVVAFGRRELFPPIYP